MRTLSLIVASEDDGRQIGRVVKGRLNVSARQLSRAKYAGGLCLDGASVHADTPVRAGQNVSITLAEDTPSFELAVSHESVEIVYEDEDLFVVNKPAPMATQSSPGQAGDALENRLAGYFNDPTFIFRPVNRLDRGTSGLMAAAKDPHVQMLLSDQLHTPAFERGYLAVTQGAPEADRGTIDLPIGKADGETVRREVRPDGKRSVTHYEVLRRSGDIALLSLLLETGRTHQIRVHTAAIGCPVYGDFLYGTARPDTLPDRFALHSARMRFTHPRTGKTLEFGAPLPEELERLLK